VSRLVLLGDGKLLSASVNKPARTGGRVRLRSAGCGPATCAKRARQFADHAGNRVGVAPGWRCFHRHRTAEVARGAGRSGVFDSGGDLTPGLGEGSLGKQHRHRAAKPRMTAELKALSDVQRGGGVSEFQSQWEKFRLKRQRRWTLHRGGWLPDFRRGKRIFFFFFNLFR